VCVSPLTLGPQPSAASRATVPESPDAPSRQAFSASARNGSGTGAGTAEPLSAPALPLLELSALSPAASSTCFGAGPVAIAAPPPDDARAGAATRKNTASIGGQESRAARAAFNLPSGSRRRSFAPHRRGRRPG